MHAIGSGHALIVATLLFGVLIAGCVDGFIQVDCSAGDGGGTGVCVLLVRVYPIVCIDVPAQC